MFNFFAIKSEVQLCHYLMIPSHGKMTSVFCAAHWKRMLSAHCFVFLHCNNYVFAAVFLIFFTSDALFQQEPWSSSMKAWLRRLAQTSIHAYTLATHDTFLPQEKPWARTGRKTLENQDTIWHLWSLNDFLLGVGLCPTGKSQKTGGENYIRENVYAAHSAPSLFWPANEWLFVCS